MMENSDNWYAMSDNSLLELLGNFIKATRLRQNKTQLQVAEAAGIARSTLVKIENGGGGNLISFTQVMRTLEQLHFLKNFQVQNEISSLQLAKLEQSKRQRARLKNKPGTQKQPTDW